MGFFRRRRVIKGEAFIRLYGHGPRADQLSASTVRWKGDDDALPYLLPAYFDKILFNLAPMPGEQQALLERFTEFVSGAQADLVSTPDTTVDARIELAPVVEEPVSEQPLAEIRVELSLIPEQERAGAATHFAPIDAENETIAELGWWTLWDWSVQPVRGNKPMVASLLDALAVQLAHYRRHGVPGLMDLGIAPYVALQGDAAEPDYPNEIGAPEVLELGAELFARDPLQYQRRAGQIVADTVGRPRLSDAGKRLVAEITYPLMSFFADQPLAELEMTPFLKGLARIQGEAISGSYALAKSETWESLDPGRFLAMMVLAAEESPAHGAARAIRGFIGDLPQYRQLSSYLQGQPTYKRLAAYAETQTLRPDRELAELVRGDSERREKLELAVSFGWKIGVALGVMDVLGYISADTGDDDQAERSVTDLSGVIYVEEADSGAFLTGDGEQAVNWLEEALAPVPMHIVGRGYFCDQAFLDAVLESAVLDGFAVRPKN
jgi:hypothetical protein